jgi:hypothetical protein
MKQVIKIAAIAMIAIVAVINLTLTSNTPTSRSFLTLNNIETLGQAEFVIKSTGNVGIFNLNPSVALEIGSSGSSRAVKVNGTTVHSSDSRLKENIHTLETPLEELLRLNSVSYNYIGSTYEGVLDGKSEEEQAEIAGRTRILDKALAGRNIYGFLAEEVREIFPDLVYEDDSTGMLSLDYNGLIPVLVSSVQEQQKLIEAQQAQINELKSLLKSSSTPRSPTAIDEIEVSDPVLYQNAPNPFTEQTEICYRLPANAATAEIRIFDLNGKLTKKYPADRSGITLIKGSDLKAGQYVYSLVVDGNLVDSKKMVLTK